VILGLILGVGWFLFYLAGHALIFRNADDASKARLSQQLLILGLLGLISSNAAARSLIDSDALLDGGWLMGAVWGALAYLGLFCLYTPFYYVVTSSLSVQTLVILLARPENAIPLAALREEFASRDFLQARLHTMLDNGFLFRRSAQGFALTPKGELLAQLFSRLKQFWKLAPGG
jgi:hypothetical protein